MNPLPAFKNFDKKKLLLCKTPKLKTFYEAICFQKKWDLNKRPKKHTFHEGFDSWVLECDQQIIYKFPKNEKALHHLYKEAQTLNFIRNKTNTLIPNMVFYERYFYFTEHKKISGNTLSRPIVDTLATKDRLELAQKLANFFSDLHSIKKNQLCNLPIESYSLFSEFETLSQYVQHSSDFEDSLKKHLLFSIEICKNEINNDVVFGHFDVHGRNMAFDEDRKKLVGVFDFADCAFMNFHAEFMYPAELGPDLLNDLMIFYEAKTGRHVNRAIVSAFRCLMLCNLMKMHTELELPEKVSLLKNSLNQWCEQDFKQLH